MDMPPRPPVKPLEDLPENTGESPIPNITAEELRGHVVVIRRQLNEIVTALQGDKYGNPGVLPRLDAVEKKTDAHDRKLLVWGSLLTAIGIFIGFVKDVIYNAK